MVIELASGDDRVQVDEERGGRLASLFVSGKERLLGQTDDPMGWGCFPMIPWAGRVAGAEIEQYDVELEANEGENALHGVCFDVPWTVDRAAGNAAELLCTLPRNRWPLGGLAAQRITLSSGSLDLEIQVQAGAFAMPVSVGWHPWFRRPDSGDMTVVVDTDAVLETDDQLVPTGEVLTVSRKLDLRRGARLGRRRLDHAYVGVEQPVTVRWPDLELMMELPASPAAVVVHTPSHAVCVEPQTAWPDPFRWGDRSGASHLDPYAIFTARTRWTWKAV